LIDTYSVNATGQEDGPIPSVDLWNYCMGFAMVGEDVMRFPCGGRLAGAFFWSRIGMMFKVVCNTRLGTTTVVCRNFGKEIYKVFQASQG
jgi:hypothetical protein